MVVTLNPALDITHVVERVDWAGVNRPHSVHVRPGGKGVNVARTLRALGADVTLAGLAGGRAGRELTAGLAGAGISIALTEVAGETRRTFAVADAARGATALFNEPGPWVSEGEYAEFLVTYKEAVQGCTAVVLSGSLPLGIAPDAYAELIGAAAAAGVPVVLDASGAALVRGAGAGPAVVKPNLAELEAAVGRDLGQSAGAGAPGGAGASGGPDLAAVERAARELIAHGTGGADGKAAAVVVSLGYLGLLAVTPAGTWYASLAEPVTGNPVGAGDAVVAALVNGLVRRQPWPDRLRHAAALGAATVVAPVAGEFHTGSYQQQLASVTVTGPPGSVAWPADAAGVLDASGGGG